MSVQSSTGELFELLALTAFGDHGQHQGGPALDGGGRKRGLRALRQGRPTLLVGGFAQGLVGGAEGIRLRLQSRGVSAFLNLGVGQVGGLERLDADRSLAEERLDPLPVRERRAVAAARQECSGFLAWQGVQLLDHLEVVAGDLVFSAAGDEVGILAEVFGDRAEAEAAAGRDEFLLDLHAVAHQVHGAVVIDPLVDSVLTTDVAASVADADLCDLGDEAVHTLEPAPVGGDHLEVDLPDRLADAGERVLEIPVLPVQSAQQVVQPELVEIVHPGGDGLLLVALP